jgi:hypothetical protein
MLPYRDNLKRMLASMNGAIASTVKWPPDEGGLRTWLRESVRLSMLETNEADRDWVKGQLERCSRVMA